MAWSSGVSRIVAMITAGVLLVLVGVGYLIVRVQVAHRQIEREEQAYQKWVNGFAAGLGERPAVVILEPDALAQLDKCLDGAQQQSRLNMLSYAVKTLQKERAQVYLDAGHSNWVPAGEMAARLRAAGIAQAHGFALNVSNYNKTAREVDYATALNRKLGMDKRFVVDTSRNGTGRTGGQVQPVATPIGQALPGAGGGAPASQLFTDPASQAANWVKANPDDPRAQEIEQSIANWPTGKWFGEWSGRIAPAVRSYTMAASSQQQVPILVAYNIPHRDCGGPTPGPKPWCNPPGRQLGSVPQALDKRGNMGLWIKAPGESDGNCGLGAGTQPGEFSPRIATALITGKPAGSSGANP